MAITEPYSMKWASSATEIDPVQIRDWHSRSYLYAVRKSEGQGKANLFSRQNLFQIKLFSAITKTGLSRDDASKICKEFKTYSSKTPILGIFREGENSRVAWVTKKQAQEAVTLKELDSVVIINVSKIVADIIKKLDKIKVMPARVIIS